MQISQFSIMYLNNSVKTTEQYWTQLCKQTTKQKYVYTRNTQRYHLCTFGETDVVWQ